MRQNEFLVTFGTIKDLDFCTPSAFPLLYAFKLADLKAQTMLSEEVTHEFKTGKTDPSKLIGTEKMARQLASKKRNKK
jgi:hypothetical protein